MNANELRIGNWIRRKEDKEELQTKTGILSNWHALNTRYSGYEPIPITEDWLIKFGFARTQYQFELNDLYLNPPIIFHNNTLMLKNLSFGAIRLDGQHYVHQLQNLYFALTGKELTI